MQKIGEYLLNLRQEKGFTIDDVSKKTKMSPSVIRALEEGRLDNINSVYLKGFLKLYCRFLGVDWEAFQKAHLSGFTFREARKPSLPTTKPAPGKPEESESRRYFMVERGRDRFKKPLALVVKHQKTILRMLAFAVFFLLLFFLIKGCAVILAKMPKSVPGKSQKADVSSGLPFQKGQPVKKQKQSLTRQEANSSKRARSVELGVRVREDVFVKVRVDGKSMFQGVLRAGIAEVWKGKEKIELSVNDSASIDIEANGQKMSPIGRRSEPKNIVVTPEGARVL